MVKCKQKRCTLYTNIISYSTDTLLLFVQMFIFTKTIFVLVLAHRLACFRGIMGI